MLRPHHDNDAVLINATASIAWYLGKFLTVPIEDFYELRDRNAAHLKDKARVRIPRRGLIGLCFPPANPLQVLGGGSPKNRAQQRKPHPFLFERDHSFRVVLSRFSRSPARIFHKISSVRRIKPLVAAIDARLHGYQGGQSQGGAGCGEHILLLLAKRGTFSALVVLRKQRLPRSPSYLLCVRHPTPSSSIAFPMPLA